MLKLLTFEIQKEEKPAGEAKKKPALPCLTLGSGPLDLETSAITMRPPHLPPSSLPAVSLMSLAGGSGGGGVGVG